MLGDDKNVEINENEIKIKENKTVINQHAFDEIATKDRPHSMSPGNYKKVLHFFISCILNTENTI